MAECKVTVNIKDIKVRRVFTRTLEKEEGKEPIWIGWYHYFHEGAEHPFFIEQCE